jgi:WD40 repeat protein
VRVWDASTGCLLQVFKGHSGWVKSVSFSTDGAFIVSGSCDKTVQVWDTTTGSHLQTSLHFSSEVYRVKFSTDGKSIFAQLSNGEQHAWQPSCFSRSIPGGQDNVLPSEEQSYFIQQTCLQFRRSSNILQTDYICWLPSHLQLTESLSYRNVIAIGTKEGRLLILDTSC